MNRIRTMSVSLTLVACLGMVIPQAALAEITVTKRPIAKILDISLHDGGLLVGQVVNPQGTPRSGVEVRVFQKEHELFRTKTDKQGRFAVKGLAGGSYSLATSSGQIPVRAWSKSTAPPAAAVAALMVEGTAVRGQCNCAPGAISAGYATNGQVVESGNAIVDSSGAYSDAASFNQGGASFNQGGASSTYYNDAGASYVDGSSEYYDASGGNVCYGSGHAGHGHGVGAGGGGGLLGLGILGHGGGAAGLLASPWFIGGAVAAAIAIPIALDDDDAS